MKNTTDNRESRPACASAIAGNARRMVGRLLLGPLSLDMRQRLEALEDELATIETAHVRAVAEAEWRVADKAASLLASGRSDAVMVSAEIMRRCREAS